MKKLFLILFFIAANAQADYGRVEPILGYSPSARGLNFQVSSGGCTKASDFAIKKEYMNDGDVVALTLVRVEEDPCLSFVPTGVQIQLSLQDIGIAPNQKYMIRNPNGVVQSWIWNDEIEKALR